MKSKKNIKLLISVVSLLIFMLATGCSSTNKTSNSQQSSTINSSSENNKSSDAATTTNNPVLQGTVTKIDGNKISISPKTQKSNGVAVGQKKGSPATGNVVTFEAGTDTSITIRTLTDKGMKYADSTGSISDIKIDSTVDIWGKKDGDVITSTKIIIYIFN